MISGVCFSLSSVSPSVVVLLVSDQWCLFFSQRCQFKCGSVGGMQYHYLRCTGQSPHFKCPQCSRRYESRTGLNYHMASNHGTNPIEEVKVRGVSGWGTERVYRIRNGTTEWRRPIYCVSAKRETLFCTWVCSIKKGWLGDRGGGTGSGSRCDVMADGAKFWLFLNSGYVFLLVML